MIAPDSRDGKGRRRRNKGAAKRAEIRRLRSRRR